MTGTKSQIELAYDTLRAALLSCQIAPDSKIRIKDVGAQHGFSAGAVREALSKLSSDGLVIAEPQRGFRAAPISNQDLQELTVARVQIETLCLKMAVETADLEWEGKVIAAHHALSKVPLHITGTNDALSPVWTSAHAAFHDALAQGCENRWLLRTRKALYEQAERYRHLSVPMGQQDRDVPEEHRLICDAAVARDGHTACKLLAEHIEKTTLIIVEANSA